MNKPNAKPVVVALGAAIAGLALSGSAFAMQPLAQGYMLAATDGAHDHAEGKCGEGKCGGECKVEAMDTDQDGRLSPAEFATAHAGDGSRFAAHDGDGDGFISSEEMSAHHAGKADKGAGEGKCGEGKCGEGKCGAM